jgi:hypothetical protein
MKRVALLLLSAVMLAYAAPAFAEGAEDELLFSFTGFDYEDPDNSGTYLDLLEGYRVVGFVTSVGPLLTPWVDPSLYEYTIYIRDLTVNGRFFTFPNLTVTFFNNGRGSYYEDEFPINGGTAAVYGTNPPNATAPSTFIDGAEQITGDVDNFVLVYNFLTNQGSFAGNMTIDGGDDLIYVPPPQRAGWVLGGLLGPPNATIPAGYDHQVDGECRIPGKTPATHKSWGSIKALYR